MTVCSLRPHDLSATAAALGLLFVLVSGPRTVHAQVVFAIDHLPSRVGDYRRAYLSTNETDVSGLLGAPGGPRRWDFARARQTGEVVRRMDVVATSDGGHQASFPGAAYAERATRESDGALSWSYYQIIPERGREYYGFYDAAANPALPVKAFAAPTIDLPARIEFGQSWSRTVEFGDLLDALFFQVRVAVRFTCQARVDAWGTLVLPGLGEVPALRVNEANRYDFTDMSLGLPIPSQYFRNYYWLTPGIGKAVEIVAAGEGGVPPENFTIAKTVLRVFESASQVALPVSDLRICLEDGVPNLRWRAGTTAGAYRVETTGNLPAVNWRVLARVNTNAWRSPFAASQKEAWFRVFAEP
jgi:hypothetical protein